METTYNAKYKDTEIPLPKTKIKRWRSKSAATLRNNNVSYQEETMVGKSTTYTIVSPELTRSKSCMSNVHVEDSNSGVHRTATENNADESSKQNKENGLSVIQEKVESETDFEQNISVYENTYPLIFSGDSNAPKMSKHFNTSKSEESLSIHQMEIGKENNFQSFQLNELYNLEKRHDLFMPKLITLPKIYEMEIEASKGAYKRMLQRSMSRVSFSVPTPKGVEDQSGTEYRRHSITDNSADQNDNNNDNAVIADASYRPKPDVDAVQSNTETLSNSQNLKSDGQIDTGQIENEIDKSLLQNRSAIQRSVSVGAEFFPSTLVQVAKSSRCEDVLYKGKWLRNYIRPEERYKLDPVILRRRQLKMDKLAKQSDTYLGRINHENISVDIAFPRTVRNRILQQLIDANSSGKRQIPSNPDEELLAAKIELFLKSVSHYVSNQNK